MLSGPLMVPHRILVVSVFFLWDPTEFTKMLYYTGLGFLIVGFTGFFVKLISLPIINLIV